jgi:hypothetical protein
MEAGMAEQDQELLERIDAVLGEATVDIEKLRAVGDAVRNRVGDALTDLGLEALIPEVTVSTHFGVVVNFPQFNGHREFDKVLNKLVDLSQKARTSGVQTNQVATLPYSGSAKSI